MKKFLEYLRRHTVVGLDTSLFIYHLEDHPRYGVITADLFSEMEKGGFKGMTSFLTLMEILVKPKADGKPEVVQDYEFVLTTFPNLSFVPLGLEVTRRAADLRAAYRLRAPDSIQVASALVQRATALLTNDKKLKVVNELDVSLLDDWLPDLNPNN
jgi:predicted nucleic acid-binding protein